MPAKRTVYANTLDTMMKARRIIAVSIPVIPLESLRIRDNIGSIPGSSYHSWNKSIQVPYSKNMVV